DGIRDFHVTGVQTCALPISHLGAESRPIYSKGKRCTHRNCPVSAGNPLMGVPVRHLARTAAVLRGHRLASTPHRFGRKSRNRRANGTCTGGRMRRLLLSGVLVLATALPARAVSLNDLIDLSRAGLSDDILIELVEADRSVFHLDAATLKRLKAEGLSDRLLLHLLRTPALREAQMQAAYEPLPEPPAPPPAPAPPQVVIVDRVEHVAVPVY